MLRHKLLEYQAILDSASLGIAFTRDRAFLHCNQRFSEIFGWENAELLGRSTRLLYPSEGEFEALWRVADPLLTSGHRLDTELQLRHKDGRLMWCRLLGRAIDTADYRKGLILIAENITERRKADESRRQLLLEYEAILDNASLGITFTRNRIFRHCNRRFYEMFGWDSASLIGQPTSLVYPSEQAFEEMRMRSKPILGAGMRFETELQMRRRDGTLFWCRLLGRAIDPIDYGKGTIYITEDITERKSAQEALLRARDELELRVRERTAELAMANARLQAEIQERKLAEQQIRYLANHDALTGLPNRRLLEDRLEQAMEMSRRHGNQVAVQFIDIDHFKPINDRFGHRVGDLVLQAIAVRLRTLLRAADTVARVGGDEFVLVLPDIQEAAAGDLAQKVLNALVQPYQIEGLELVVTPSIGISIFPGDGLTAEALLTCADTAMYHAKKLGRANYQQYSPTMPEGDR